VVRLIPQKVILIALLVAALFLPFAAQAAKVCPKCGKVYSDDRWKYCADDGTVLKKYNPQAEKPRAVDPEIERLRAEKAETERRVRAAEERARKAEEEARKAAAPQPSPAAEKKADDQFKDPVRGMEFVSLKGGCFQMGDTFGDGGSDERPVHEVCVDDFHMGKYEVRDTGRLNHIIASSLPVIRYPAACGGGVHNHPVTLCCRQTRTYQPASLPRAS
jgi:hypothetical protein